MKNFDPSKLMTTVTVNPRVSKDWEMRVNADSLKVSVHGLKEKLDLETNGINFSPYGDQPKPVILWTAPKEEAMSVKGSGTEYKMTALVSFLRKADLLKANEKIVYFKLNPIEGQTGYYEIVRDEDLEVTLFNSDLEADADPTSSTSSKNEVEIEPSEEEIEDSVAASK